MGTREAKERMIGESNAQHGQDRRRATLERLLALEAVDLDGALQEAAQIVADALGADKVDAFVYEANTECLVARGTSDTPMGRHQIALGLNRLPLAHGGRAVTLALSDCVMVISSRAGHPSANALMHSVAAGGGTSPG